MALVIPRPGSVRRARLAIVLAIGLVACADDSTTDPAPQAAPKVQEAAPPPVPQSQARSAPLRGCRLPEGHPRYCAECGSCGHGQGGCGSDSDCLDGLDCVAGAGAAFGYASATPVCVSGDCRKRVGESSYCEECGPCPLGQGDCDDDDDCAPGLICKGGGGDRYGLPGRDVCAPDPCDTDIGGSDYCSTCGPCPEGIGDCDGDRECMPGLVCVANHGEESGYKRSVDVCEAPRRGRPRGHANLLEERPFTPGEKALIAASRAAAPAAAPECGVEMGNSNYCRDCGPCPHGVGDCDSADECQDGLRCKDNAGAEFGMKERVDVCVGR